ncbi:hypothetical protein M8J75_015593 [Diaphorina citri]|nr:hypothetical protein M8J75_015593 [Diaphorina citri]
MDSSAANMRYHLNRGYPKSKSTVTTPLKHKSLSDSSLLNELTLYTFDYTTGKGVADKPESGEGQPEMEDEGGVSFVRLLKRELSKKKIQENGTMTEEYKDNYFKLVELNQTLTKSINQIKNKIKQYKQSLNNINEKHEEEMQLYSNQMEDMKKNIVHEKAKLEEEQRDIVNMRNSLKEMTRKIETFESEIHKTVDARKTAETEGTYKDCEIVTVKEAHDMHKQSLQHLQKELEAVRENAKRFNHTKKLFEEKIDFLLNTNEKIKVYFENLLLDNETLKLENKSFEKVLKAHENICLELLKIAADKLDSHNDGKVLNEITDIMKKLDENKERYTKQLKKIQSNRQQKLSDTQQNQMKSGRETGEVDEGPGEDYYEAESSGHGKGDGFEINQFLEDSD